MSETKAKYREAVDVEYAHYRCTNPQCRATDSDRTSNPPMILVCYACRAGSGMDLNSQMANSVGMTRVTEPYGVGTDTADEVH